LTAVPLQSDGVRVQIYWQVPLPYVWFNVKSHGRKHTSGQPCSFETTEVQTQDDWNYYIPGDGFNIFATPWWSTYVVALMEVIEIYTKAHSWQCAAFFLMCRICFLCFNFRLSPALPSADIEDPHDDNGDHELPFCL
jgi:hypothetical protein